MLKRLLGVALAALICVNIPALGQRRAQVSEAKIKAALIINFAQNIQWPNESEIATYLLGIVDGDSGVYHELRQAIATQRIKAKPFDVVLAGEQTAHLPYNILYFGENTERTLTDIYRQIGVEGVLIITDRAKDRVLTMINILYKADKNTFSFEINKDNLDAGRFTVNPKILLLGGNYLNLRELYIQTYERLKQESEKIQRYQDELERIGQEKEEYQAQVGQLNEKVLNLGKSIRESESEYLALTGKLQVSDSLLTFRTRELQSKIRESKSLQDLIKSQLVSINIATGKLDSLDDEIWMKQRELLDKQSLIENQGQEINQQSLTILKQQRRFWIAVAILLGLLLSLVFAYWAYSMKRRLNLKLEKLVEERTQELKLSRAHFENLFENSPMAIFELDLSEFKNYVGTLDNIDEGMRPLSGESPDWAGRGLALVRVVNLNQAGVSLFGFGDKQDALENFHRTYAEQVLESIMHAAVAVRNREKSSTYDGVRQTVDGQPLFVHLKWQVLPGYEESYERVLLSISDITAIKNYEKELSKHKDHLEEIVFERTNEIIKLNDDLTKSNSELSQTIRMLKDTQNKLVQSEKMASLGMLTAGIAHEINNPINYISGSYQALQSLMGDFGALFRRRSDTTETQNPADAPEGTGGSALLGAEELYQSVKFLLDNIETGITRITSIVKSLMAFSRNEKEELSEYSIPGGVKDVLVILKSKYHGRIAVEEQYGANLPNITCNANGVGQVLMNLVSNAIDAIPDQGRVSIEAEYLPHSDEVVIRVHDTGTGIPSGIIGKIFDPFFTTKEVGKGTGLGLYISYTIVKLHRGAIDVVSEPGVGTTFAVRLPRSLG